MNNFVQLISKIELQRVASNNARAMRVSDVKVQLICAADRPNPVSYLA